MSRTGEILRRYGLDKIPITQEIEETKLWLRFKKVKEAVLEAIKAEDNLEGITRTVKTNSAEMWEQNFGRHDHIGEIRGTVDKISIDISFTGRTHNVSFYGKFDGCSDWTIMNDYGRVLKIWGTFKSGDGRIGYMEINNDNYYQKNYEAYWLQTEGNKLRLEQVVENGRVFNAEDLKRFRNNIETEHGVSLPSMRFVKNE